MADDIMSVIRRQVRTEVTNRLSAMDRRASTLERLTSTEATRGRKLDGRAADLLRRLVILEGLALVFRKVSLQLPQLPVGNTEIAVEWDVPFILADYAAAPALEAGPVVLSKLTAGIKAGSRLRTGCVVVVSNGAAVAIPAGAILNVLAWRSPGDA
ncbi:MAG: hypothetical protein M3Q39_00455 [Actinomycetota bacterium]|nr:hypothetical protein [Actinomycetota bacterium]